MALGIHRNYLDFEILETGNPLTLVFVDSSQYMDPPDRPMLEVFMPGFNKYTLANVVANQVNTFNANTLNVSKSLGIDHLTVLPDGVWRFTYKICPYDIIFVHKNYLRTTLLDQKINSAYNDIDLAGCVDKTVAYIANELTRAQILIRGAKAAVNADPKKSGEYYQLASRIVDNVLSKFCKNCKQWGVVPVGV